MSEWMLETQGLGKSFMGLRAVHDVHLRVRRGSVHALIGPNGAGKTTLFNLVTRFVAPSAGRIRYRGEDITALRPEQLARIGLARSFQISAVFPELTVLQNVRLALQRARMPWYVFWRGDAALQAFDAQALRLLEQVGLAPLAQRRAGELSYGRKRAVEIATTLALDPQLLLLDEPMAGLGTEDIAAVAALIRAVSRDRTVLMVEHNLPVVADLCDRVTVLARGEILAEGGYAEVAADPAVRTAYMGTGLQ
ncbi:MAG: ABC transporter ATP-binding protein [Pseudomonadota bacterium]